MSTGLNDTPRKIIPRWRDSKIAATTGELEPLAHQLNPRIPLHDELGPRKHDWRANRSIAYATDLISAGLVTGDKHDCDVGEAVDFILGQDLATESSARRLAEFVAEGGHDNAFETAGSSNNGGFEKSSRQQIQLLRRRIRNNPRNAIAWVDMARHYAVLGAEKQAFRSIANGLALAPHNRFVLRSTARFFVHNNDPEKAYDVLRRNPVTLMDPWLRAAEIAVGSMVGKTPARLGRTKKNLRHGASDPGHISELASAVATVELDNGANKSARRLFDLGLVQPTENAVAQADWAQTQLPGISLDESHFGLPGTYEANAAEYFEKFDFEHCIQECERWLSDEPFSSRPLELKTFLSLVVFEDFGEAISSAMRGLVSNPDNFLLCNNLTIALAESGNVEDAKTRFESVRVANLEFQDRTCWLGTNGLLAFRANDKQLGRAFYEQAASDAELKTENQLVALALFYWAGEEILAGERETAAQIAEQADHFAGGSPRAAIKLAKRRFLKLRRRTLDSPKD